ncbi:MAG TPA: efflux RND transporter periplasmic adaptor subunit [Pirellulales bacterium]|jgi:cobalt-zinc-cadmium efflux system membrane fusion protein|nr:efflux RND transporter periplasmic adaptor subunit [Pirellulales bacterium]
MTTLSIRPPGLLARVRKQAFQLNVLAILALIGWWGHKNHWQFSHEPERVTAIERTVARPETAPAASPSPQKVESPLLSCIRFESERQVADLGITVLGATCRPLAREVTAPGTVTYDPARHAQLSVRVSGTVWRIEKHLGEPVRAGEVLAIIDAPAVGQAKAEFLHSIADVQLSKKVYEPLQSFANGEVPRKQIRAAETELRKAKVDMFNAHQALVSLGLPIDLGKCEQAPEEELERHLKFLGLPASIADTLDPASTSASLLPIHAPFDGLVIGRDLSVGEVVSPSQTYFEVADVSKMWILLNVREADSDSLELGQKVAFSAGTAKIEGAISWMSTAVDPKTRTVEVRCSVDNPEVLKEDGQQTGKRLLRANLFGLGRIELSHNPVALAVPTQAVQWDGSDHVVFVRMGANTFEPRRVHVGITTDEYTEVLDHLNIDDPVVVRGSHILKAELGRSLAASPP